MFLVSRIISLYNSLVQNCHLIAKQLRRHVTLTTPIWGTVCYHKTNTSRASPCTKFDDFIFVGISPKCLASEN